MNEPIKVGDLVYIDRLMPCGHGVIGFTFTVTKIRPVIAGGSKCTVCGTVRRGFMVAERDDGTGRVCEISRLKRIPPLSELEGEKRDEKLTEPA